jgi:porphobilinogen deaminase
MHSPVRIGTRGSQLALWQARTVATSLEALGVAAELVIIRTSGDRLQEAPLSEVGGKRLFVKEIEDALLRDEIDLAVHSAKDMPAVLPEALALGATLPRTAKVADVTLDGKKVGWQQRSTNRGLEITTKTGAGRHTVVVTTR